MLDFLRHGSRRPRSETFGQLTIEKRVLITPKSTISIPNIAAISSGTIKVPSRLVWALVLALLAGGIGAFAYGTTRAGFTESAAGVAMVMGALVAGALLLAHREAVPVHIQQRRPHLPVHRPAQDLGGGAPAAVGQDQRRRRERRLPHQLREGRHADRERRPRRVGRRHRGGLGQSRPGRRGQRAPRHRRYLPAGHELAGRPARQRPLRRRQRLPRGLRAGAAQHRRDAALLCPGVRTRRTSPTG